MPESYLAEIPKQVPVKDALLCGSTLLHQWTRASPTLDLTSLAPFFLGGASKELCDEVLKCLSEVPEIQKLVVHVELERVDEQAIVMRMPVRHLAFCVPLLLPGQHVLHVSSVSTDLQLCADTKGKSFDRCGCSCSHSSLNRQTVLSP